jgi:hypothetical protein
MESELSELSQVLECGKRFGVEENKSSLQPVRESVCHVSRYSTFQQAANTVIAPELRNIHRLWYI